MERRKRGLLTPTTVILAWDCVSKEFPSFPWLHSLLTGYLFSFLSSSLLPLPSLSSLVFWADPQSISPPRQPQKNNVYCIYNIYGSYGSQSHLAHGVLPTYLPTYRQTPQKFNLFIVQFMGRAASGHCLGKDGWWEFASLPLGHRGGKIVYGQMELSSHCLLPSLAIICQLSGFLFSYSRAAVGWKRSNIHLKKK